MNTVDTNTRIDTLADVDHAGRRLRVQSGKLTTDWLPRPVEIGRNFKRWSPLRINSGVSIARLSDITIQASNTGILCINAILVLTNCPKSSRFSFQPCNSHCYKIFRYKMIED